MPKIDGARQLGGLADGRTIMPIMLATTSEHILDGLGLRHRVVAASWLFQAQGSNRRNRNLFIPDLLVVPGYRIVCTVAVFEH